MTISELKDKIGKLGVPPFCYSFDGTLVDGIMLDNMTEPDCYRVFRFDERGNTYEERKFSSEEGACDYMLELILEIARLLPKHITDKYKSS